MAIGHSSKKLLAIDWDAKDLRLVLVRPRTDGVDLLKAISVPIPRDVVMDDAESLGAFVREAVRQAKVRAKRAVLSIPRDQVVLNTLSLPPSPEEDLPSIVQFQIAKELPFAADQATIDFAVCGTFDPKESCSVLVAAVRNEQLGFFRNVAAEAGLTLERIGLRPHANLLAVLAKAPGLQDKSLLVVEVGPRMTEIDIIRGGAVAFSRAASVMLPEFDGRQAGQIQDSRIQLPALEDRESDEATRKAVSELMVEVVRSFEAYRATEPGASVDQIIVCGATDLEKELAEALASRFAAQAALYMPDRALDLTPQRAKELRGFSAALGLALGHSSHGPSHFDFLHPKKPVSRRAVRMKKLPAAILAAVLLIAAGVTAHLKIIQPLVDEMEPLEAAVNKMKPKEKPIRAFAKQVKALDKWGESEQYWPEVLVSLTNEFPPEEEAFITHLDFETKRPRKKSDIRPSTVKIRLRTAEAGDVNTLGEKLRKLWGTEVKIGKDVPIGARRADVIYHFDTSIHAELPMRQKPDVDEVEETDRVQPPPVEEPAGRERSVRSGENAKRAPGVQVPKLVAPTGDNKAEKEELAARPELVTEPDVTEPDDTAARDKKPDANEEPLRPVEAGSGEANAIPRSTSGPTSSPPHVTSEPAPSQPMESKGGSQ